MLRWPSRAKVAIRALFRPLQDLEIYVEDEHDEVFYRALFQRLANSKLRIARVVALGGRASVVAAAAAHPANGPPSLFIIDGDLEWVRGDPPPDLPFLHRLDAYCIDNFLICEQGACVVMSQDVVMAEDAAKQALALGDWLAQIEAPLVELFSAFATSNQLNPPAPTVSNGVGVLCVAAGKKRAMELSFAKVEQEIQRILVETAQVAGTEVTQELFHATLSRALTLPRPVDVVSGKDFLLPLLMARLHSLGCVVKRRALRMRLASSCQVDRLSLLHSAMMSIANKSNA